MLALPPRSPDVRYYEFYAGIHGFDCAALRSTLTPASCAANWKSKKEGSACIGCRVGAIHAGLKEAPPPPAPRVCCRCGNGSRKFVGGVLCISCYNRVREALRGTNCKGSYPWHTGAKLREVVAIVMVDSAASALRSVFATRQSKIDSQVNHGIHQDHLPGLPLLSGIDARHVWINAIVTGTDELARIVARLLPAGEIAEAEFSASFAEKWRAAGAVQVLPPKS